MIFENSAHLNTFKLIILLMCSCPSPPLLIILWNVTYPWQEFKLYLVDLNSCLFDIWKLTAAISGFQGK